MPHKNPTLSAETQVLDPAHPSSRVGSGNPPDQNPEDTSQFSAIFSQAERLQLSEAIDLNLKDEIKMMKKRDQGIRQSFRGCEKWRTLQRRVGQGAQ